MSGMSLTAWLSAMGYSPWHANQLVNATYVPLAPATHKCDTITYEYAWGWADRCGRTNIRQAIEDAEQILFQYEHVWPSPRFREVTLPYPRTLDKQLRWGGDFDATGRWMSITLDEGYIQAAGYEHAETPVVAALTFSDMDGDGLFETATCTAAVSAGTTDDQVAVQFLAADCGPITPRPQIAPRSVSVVGLSATVVFNAWDLVKPIKVSSPVLATYDPAILPPAVTTPYAASVEVYRHWCDPNGITNDTAQALLMWETEPYPGWATCCDPLNTGDYRDPAAIATALARVTLRNARAGIVAVGGAAYDATLGQWIHPCDWTCYRPPDRLTLRYQAGIPLSGISTAQPRATVIARLAAAELARPICACAAANKELYEWQKDLSQTGATDDLYQAPEDMTNPIGSRRGHLQAWRHIKDKVRTVGILAG